MQNRRQPEIIAGRVNSDGSIAAGDGFSSVRTGTGTYALTFAVGFRLISITASQSVTGDQRWPTFTSVTDRSATVLIMDSTGVTADRAFSFIAAGIQQ